MRLRDVNLTSIVLKTFLFLQLLPIVLSCIYLLNGWTPMSVGNRTARADIVLSGHVIRAFKEPTQRTDAMTYTATVKLFEVYKGHKLLRNIPTSKETPNIYNITNFGDRKMCYADIEEEKNYIFFLTTYKQRLSAKYDDIFGAATTYTETNAKLVQDQIGDRVADWSEWSSCSRSCDRGQQVRKRNCTETDTACKEAMDRRACNSFPCDGVHDLLSYLGVYKLPLGVYHVHQRSGAFNVTKSAKLFSPFSAIYAYNLPQQFSVIMSVKCDQNFSSYIFTLSDLIGLQRFAIKLRQQHSATELSVEFHKTDQRHRAHSNLRDSMDSIKFELRPKRTTWQQLAIKVTEKSVELHYDCDKIIQKEIQGVDFSVLNSNLMMSLGPYFARYGSPFEGAIEQLVVMDDDAAAGQQCSQGFGDSDRAIKDEGNNEIDETGDFGKTDHEDRNKEDWKTKTPGASAPPVPTTTEAPLSEWTEWSQCSRSCGRGVQTRTLYCGNNVISTCAQAGLESEQARWCHVQSCQVGCRPACENGGRCLQTGRCFCPQGYSGPSCQNVDCELPCMNGGRCISPGLCACPVGYTGNTCQTALCNPSCGNGGRCIQPGYCACPYGYMPPNCDPICILPCRNGGRCVRHNQCKCPKGYVGIDCSMPVCRRGCYNGGRCVAPGQCTCPRGFTGSRCQRPVCNPSCQNSGRCLYPGICQCKRGFTGILCEELVCRKPCQNGGVCSGENRCACPEGYRGRWCHKPIKSKKCRVTCLNGGKCRKNRCRCKKGFSGQRCEKRECNFETYLMPYIQTYRRFEKREVITACDTWQWSTCVETRVQYVLASRTLYRTSYRCV